MEGALFTIQAATLVAVIVYVYKTWEIATATKRAAEATRDAAQATSRAAAATARSAEISEHTLQEMREARDQEIAPYVIAYFTVSENRHLIHFVVPPATPAPPTWPSSSSLHRTDPVGLPPRTESSTWNKE